MMALELQNDDDGKRNALEGCQYIGLMVDVTK